MSTKVLSVHYNRNRLGAACYDQETATIYLLTDLLEDEDDFRMVHSLLLQLEPSIVIVSKMQDVNFLAKLNKACVFLHRLFLKGFGERNNIISQVSNKEIEEDAVVNQEGVDDGDVDGSDEEAEERPIIALHLMPAIAYSEVFSDFEDAKKRILSLFESSNFTKEENDLRLAFRLDLTATNMISAFGALLKYLDAVRLGVEFEDINMKTPIATIKTITLEEIVHIDDSSRRALQIFKDEPHPSASKAYTVDGVREGISLFRMCNRCQSKNGEALLRCWFERPTTNRETLTNRVAAIHYFVQDCNLDAADFIRIRLKKICVLKTCNTAQQIMDYIKKREIKLSLFDDEMTNVAKDVTRITAVIFEVINFPESFMENRFVVNANVDGNLDQCKMLFYKLQISLLLNVPSSVCYIPMFGYLLVVPKNTTFPSSVHNEIEVLYEAENAMHVKNERMRQLDREIGDIKMEIIDIETNAMLKLKQLICRYDKAIRQAIYICATLDCIISLALTAREYQWYCPRYVDESVIEVDDGRHAIMELLSTSKFVPNPVRSGGAQTKVKILMGPNASGKSIYLKQIGIIVFLAHIGSFVPAKNAIIGPVDRIITRMHTLDCVLDGMSTFATDLSQMAVALRRGTGNSLILIDEFGKGTVMEAGISLLTSSLNYWIRKGKTECPHVFAVSHFHSLIDHIVKDANLLSFLTMNVTLNDGNFDFQYKLVDGFIDFSHASHIASKMGIDNEIIKRANQVHECFKSNIPIDPVDDDGELLFKIAPLLENLNTIDFTVDLKDFLQVMAELLLPGEKLNVTSVEESSKNESVGIEIENDDSVDVEKEQADSMRSDNKTAKLGNTQSHGSTSGVLQKSNDTTDTLTDLLDGTGENNDTTSNVIDSFLNVTGKLSIMKKTKFGRVSFEIQIGIIYI
uniref:DNA_MISMATCH_REPAIR_2 domain-containing protein n=1 Tax=Elaeophora elaphi TaxID=1147741 RepID=A0A0R3S1D7_9BILA